jgi:hypothetical protein
MSDLKLYLKNSSKLWDAGSIIQLSYHCFSDTPCDTLECDLICESVQGDASFAFLYFNNICIFEGSIDKQHYSFSPRGSSMKIFARRKIAASLLDNEAKTADYRSARMSDIIIKHALPYGIKKFILDEDRRIPIFTVSKGMSEWEVIDLFARYAYGFTPYIDINNNLIIRKRNYNNKNFFFSNYSNDPKYINYLSLNIENNLYKIISQVYVINENGFQTLVENPKFPNISRRRFLSPSTEWALFPRKGAEELINNSMRDNFIVKLEIPEFLNCKIGDSAIINELSLDKSLFIDNIELRFDGLLKTNLTLK